MAQRLAHVRGSEDDTAKRNEKTRRAYRPRKVEMLFVGESPPASGRFFYNRDSGLYRAMRDVFQAADRTVTEENFLKRFQKSGCYLIDLCGQPVDKVGAKQRREACIAGEALLCRRIRTMQPKIIVPLVHSISANVERAVNVAGWQGTTITVPYPGRWIRHRERFQELLLPHLKVR